METRHHSHPANPSIRPSTASDSLFGMALTQAFMGMAYGDVADAAWETGEVASAVYEDRRTNGKGQIVLGVKNNSLVDAFARPLQSLAEKEHEFFRPLQTASMAFRLN